MLLVSTSVRPARRVWPTVLLAGSLALVSCGTKASSDRGLTTSTEATTTTEPERGDPPQMRPVVSSAPCSIDETTTTVAESVTASDENGLCYELGSDLLEVVAIESVEVTSDPAAGTTVEVTFAPDDVDAANAMFNACFAGDPICPAFEGGTGKIAILTGSTVISAPNVQSEDLADSPLQISGNFSKPEADELAAALEPA